MMAASNLRKTPRDPWKDRPSSHGVAPGETPCRDSKRARSSGQRLAKDALRRAGEVRPRTWAEKESVLDEFEASVARAVARKRSVGGGRSVPDMHCWAAALGVDIESSKATERDRRRVAMQEAGHNVTPGSWIFTSCANTWKKDVFNSQPAQPHSSGGGNRHASGLAERRSPVPEVAALDVFLTDLHGRLSLLASGAARAGTMPVSTSFVRGDRNGAVVGAGMSEREAVGRTARSASADLYGVPRALVANAEEVRSS